MSLPFETVHHVCLVVRDIDKTVAFYESIGIGPWQDYPPLADYTELDVPNSVGFRDLTYRFAPLGQIQLQLVQPGSSDSPQRRFLESRGEGLFHIGFVTETADKGEAAAQQQGLVPFMRGRRSDGSGFTYFDTASEAGGVVLLVRGSRPNDQGPRARDSS